MEESNVEKIEEVSVVETVEKEGIKLDKKQIIKGAIATIGGLVVFGLGYILGSKRSNYETSIDDTEFGLSNPDDIHID